MSRTGSRTTRSLSGGTGWRSDNRSGGGSDDAVWADSAYRSDVREEQLRERGYKRRVHRKRTSRRALNQQEQATKHRRSKVRVRVGQVFRDQRMRQVNTRVRTKGQGHGSNEDRTDESGLHYATAGISAQAAAGLLHGLIGRKSAETGGKRPIRP